jgi:tetratricopeptide (TPR) repeat protein
VTQEIGHEICERQGLKALIAGTIAPLGSHYALTLEAVNCKGAYVLAREQTEAESKEQVLRALSQAASGLRKKLGESLSSIQKFDAPLEVTTSSLEALKAYSLGRELVISGKGEPLPFFQRAMELDPNFAMAYSALGVHYSNTGRPKLATENFTKAYALRNRVSEREKLRLTYFYYINLTGELDKAIGVLEQYKLTYPREYFPYCNLSAMRNSRKPSQKGANVSDSIQLG